MNAPSGLSEFESSVVSAGHVPTLVGTYVLAAMGERSRKPSLLTKLMPGASTGEFVARFSEGLGHSQRVLVQSLGAQDGSQPMGQRSAGNIHGYTQLRHHNLTSALEICRVVVPGEQTYQRYLLHEYVLGLSLETLLQHSTATHAPLPIPLCAAILLQACDGLNAAYQEAGLSHGTLCPDDLTITTDGVVKVRGVGCNLVRDKSPYTDPTRCHAALPNRRTDVYALGVMAWELFCGRRASQTPFPKNLCRPRQIRPSLPIALDQLVSRATQTDPKKRFPSANIFRNALVSALAQMGGPSSMADIAFFLRRTFHRTIEDHRTQLHRAEANLGLESLAGTSERPRLHHAPVVAASHLNPPPRLVPSTVRGTQSNQTPAPRLHVWWFMFVAAAVACSAIAFAAIVHFSRTSIEAAPTANVENLHPKKGTAAPAKAPSRPVSILRPLDPVTTSTASAPVPLTGLVTIRSSIPAVVYLYPSKERLGRTPLVDIALPVGRQRFKAVAGNKRTYFHLDISDTKTTRRILKTWKPAQHRESTR